MNTPLSTLLRTDEIAAITAPFEQARTLPPRAFTSMDFLNAERDRIFFANWMSVCFTGELPQPGDAQPLNILGAPILIVRQHDGGIRGHHNVSPYDGCEIVLEPQRGVSELVGAYHGWRYGLDGKLLTMPFYDGTPRAMPTALAGRRGDLSGFPVAEWGGLVFASIGGKPRQSFADYIDPLARHFGDVDLSRIAIGRDEHGMPMFDGGVVRCNWKTNFENACANVYHEAFTHELYRKSAFVPRVDADGRKTYTEVNSGGLFGLTFTLAAAGNTYPDIPVPPVLTRAGHVLDCESIISLYPNTYYTVLGSAVHPTTVIPLAPDAVNLSGATHYVGAEAACDPSLLGVRRAMCAGWNQVRDEDGRVCESVQRARGSPLASQNYYAPFWDRMHYDFTRRIVADLE